MLTNSMAANFTANEIVEEMKDLEKQLSEGGLSAHDLEKAKKKLEMEKEELNAALEVENTRDFECIVFKDFDYRKLRTNWRVRRLVCCACNWSSLSLSRTQNVD